MNFCALSGWLACDPEERFTGQAKRRYIAFTLNVETQPGSPPLFVNVKQFLLAGTLGLKAGMHVMVIGSLRYASTLFLSANHTSVMASDSAEKSNGFTDADVWQSPALPGRASEEELWRSASRGVKR